MPQHHVVLVGSGRCISRGGDEEEMKLSMGAYLGRLGRLGDASADITGTVVSSDAGGGGALCINGLTPSGDTCAPLPGEPGGPPMPTSTSALPNSPSSGCMPGDMLSMKNGSWVCVTDPNYQAPISKTLLIAAAIGIVGLIFLRTGKG